MLFSFLSLEITNLSFYDTCLPVTADIFAFNVVFRHMASGNTHHMKFYQICALCCTDNLNIPPWIYCEYHQKCSKYCITTNSHIIVGVYRTAMYIYSNHTKPTQQHHRIAYTVWIIWLLLCIENDESCDLGFFVDCMIWLDTIYVD